MATKNLTSKQREALKRGQETIKKAREIQKKRGVISEKTIVQRKYKMSFKHALEEAKRRK